MKNFHPPPLLLISEEWSFFYFFVSSFPTIFDVTLVWCFMLLLLLLLPVPPTVTRSTLDRKVPPHPLCIVGVASGHIFNLENTFCWVGIPMHCTGCPLLGGPCLEE